MFTFALMYRSKGKKDTKLEKIKRNKNTILRKKQRSESVHNIKQLSSYAQH